MCFSLIFPRSSCLFSHLDIYFFIRLKKSVLLFHEIETPYNELRYSPFSRFLIPLRGLHCLFLLTKEDPTSVPTEYILRGDRSPIITDVPIFQYLRYSREHQIEEFRVKYGKRGTRDVRSLSKKFELKYIYGIV